MEIYFAARGDFKIYIKQRPRDNSGTTAREPADQILIGSVFAKHTLINQFKEHFLR